MAVVVTGFLILSGCKGEESSNILQCKSQQLES